MAPRPRRPLRYEPLEARAARAGQLVGSGEDDRPVLSGRPCFLVGHAPAVALTIRAGVQMGISTTVFHVARCVSTCDTNGFYPTGTHVSLWHLPVR
jgi:hypothetical protein